MPTPHIESKLEDIAPIVLMPGDPKRAEYIAKNYLTDIKLVNQVRGITAYTGYYENKKVTIFPSGMGMPSIGIYAYELFNFYNVETIIRIGTMGAYVEELNVGDVVLATRAYSDSTIAKVQSDYLEDYQDPSSDVNNLIIKSAKELEINIKTGNIYSTDVFYSTRSYEDLQKKYNALGVEMESYALFHEAKISNKKAAAIFTISDSFITKLELSSEEREKNLDNMIKIALKTSLNLQK